MGSDDNGFRSPDKKQNKQRSNRFLELEIQKFIAESKSEMEQNGNRYIDQKDRLPSKRVKAVAKKHLEKPAIEQAHRAEIEWFTAYDNIDDTASPSKKKPFRNNPRHQKDSIPFPADVSGMPHRWVPVGNSYWECPKCEFGVSSITGTLDGDYVTFKLCPNCGYTFY